jgi:hypothetical protein
LLGVAGVVEEPLHAATNAIVRRTHALPDPRMLPAYGMETEVDRVQVRSALLDSFARALATRARDESSVIRA